MRALGVIAAGLIIGAFFTVAAVAAAASGGGESLEHTCSATDRQFIRTATLNLVEVGSAARDYLAGAKDAKDVIAGTRRATRFVRASKPTDPSLHRAGLLAGAMFAEYGRAIRAREDGGDAGPHMYRVYGFANLASEILRTAEPQLKALGCDVDGLL